MSKTSTDAVMLNANMMSSRKLGIGTSITNTMLTAAAGFAAYILLTVHQSQYRLRRQAIIAGLIYLIALVPYGVLISSTGDAASTGGTGSGPDAFEI